MPTPAAARPRPRPPRPGTVPWPLPRRLENRPSRRSVPRSARPPCRSWGSSVGTVGGNLVEKMQMPHHAIEILANLIEVPDAGDSLHSLLQRLEGIAAVGT